MEEEEEDVPDDVLEEALKEVVADAMAEALSDAEEEAINYKISRSRALSPIESPHPPSPVGVVEMEVEGQQENVGDPEASNVKEVGRPLPVGSFSSGIPSTPGRGFLQLDTSRGSGEQLDGQPMEVSDEDERPRSAEEARVEGNPPMKSTSRPSSRNKKRAPRKFLKRQPGDQSRSSEALEHSGLDREVESGQIADVPQDAIMAEAEHVEGTGTELNVSSPVEEVAAAVLEVFGQGRSHRESPDPVVAEKATHTEAEVVVRTEVICLDSDDEVPNKRVELDVRVKVKDRAPLRVRGTFADYMTDDSEDEDYGLPGYNRKKLSFTDDPHPLFAGRPDTTKDSDGKDKVNFAPFVDKYLSELPESVRLHLAHLYKSYDYHKMFAYLSTPAFCEAVKVKHVLHAASLKKMRKRWVEFEAPKHRAGRGQFPGSSSAQAGSVVDSTLEIIDVSGQPESPRIALTQQASDAIPSTSHADPPHAGDTPLDQAQGT